MVATRLGVGGVPGQCRRRATSANSWWISPAAPCCRWQQRFDVKPVVSASRGKIDNAYVIKVVGTDRWRALFDLQAEERQLAPGAICACSSCRRVG